MAMAASEYLSTRASGEEQDPVKSALYTGIAYIITVIFLVLPYLLVSNYLICLVWTLAHAVLIIAAFNYYISIAQDLPFRKRFMEMTAISFGVAILSFVIGSVIRRVFGVRIRGRKSGVNLRDTFPAQAG